VADDGAVLLGRKKTGPGGVHGDDIAHLGAVGVAEPEVRQAVPEPLHGDNRLRLEGGRTLNQGAAGGHVEGEQGHLEVGGKLILAALAGDLDGEGVSGFAENAVDDGPSDL